MREENVGLILLEIRDGNFLHSEDNFSFRQVLLDNGASIFKLFFRITPVTHGLNQNFDSSFDQLSDFIWGDGTSTLPFVLTLFEDANYSVICLLLYHK